jgi:hypothetical protein
MPTITASPGLVYAATNACTEFLTPSSTSNPYSSFFTTTYNQGSQFSPSPALVYSNVYFKNSLGQTLISTTMANFTRTMATNGYVVFNNFLPVTPSVNGTIAYIEISPNLTPTYYLWTLTVGAIGSGADVEIDNRDVTTTQPWRMDGSIRFRVPNSYTYSL